MSEKPHTSSSQPNGQNHPSHGCEGDEEVNKAKGIKKAVANKKNSKKVQVNKGRGKAVYTFGQKAFDVVQAAGPRKQYQNRPRFKTDGVKLSRWTPEQRERMKAKQQERKDLGLVKPRNRKKNLSGSERRVNPPRNVKGNSASTQEQNIE